ncbi:MAG: hypothetical protein A2Z04_03175 [Chloroflexi bacterium RBG_16_57_9]|nr:MAG: hypothetical protein A2Z04_03175 [Chloroflexi bacterium RBG_16_57_9]
MNARDYSLGVQAAIHAAPHVLRSEVRFDEIDVNECYIRGVLTLAGDLELHIAEYIVTDPDIRRLKYRYHLQTTGNKLVSRWDNVPHHPHIPTFPDHRHDEYNGIHPAPAMDIPGVLMAVLQFISPDS